jgi:hypothetical protein
MGGDIDLIWGDCEAEYFLKQDWTAKSLICPSGARSQEIPMSRESARRVLLLRCPGNQSSFGELSALSPNPPHPTSCHRISNLPRGFASVKVWPLNGLPVAVAASSGKLGVHLGSRAIVAQRRHRCACPARDLNCRRARPALPA